MDTIGDHIRDFKYLTKENKDKLLKEWKEKQKVWDNIEVGQHCFYSNVYDDQFHHVVVEVYPDERRLIMLDYSLDEEDGERVEKRMLPNQDVFGDSLEDLKDKFEFSKRTVF